MSLPYGCDLSHALCPGFPGAPQFKDLTVSATIALVDDDRNILTSVSIALEAEGYKVRTYNDGAEALRHLTQQMPDLVILDIKMPRLDGMETLSRLRRVSQVPVIFLTSKDDEKTGRAKGGTPVT